MPLSQLKLTSCIVCNSNYSSFFFLNYKYICATNKYKSLKALNKNCSFKQYITQHVKFVIILFLLKCKHFTSEQLQKFSHCIIQLKWAILRINNRQNPVMSLMLFLLQFAFLSFGVYFTAEKKMYFNLELHFVYF